jgi:hypothetical protein
MAIDGDLARRLLGSSVRLRNVGLVVCTCEWKADVPSRDLKGGQGGHIVA